MAKTKTFKRFEKLAEQFKEETDASKRQEKFAALMRLADQRILEIRAEFPSTPEEKAPMPKRKSVRLRLPGQ